MAVSRGATVSNFRRSDSTTTADLSHTVDSSTTLLLVSYAMQGGEDLTATPQWSLGGGENLTLINATADVGSNGDVRVEIWGLVAPTAGAGTVTCTITTSSCIGVIGTNYLGTKSDTVANACLFISETVNNTGTITTVHSSGGTSGNTLYWSGSFLGGDGDPSSADNSFGKVFEGATGGSTTADIICVVYDLIAGAASAITVTWAVTDENCGNYVEIVPDAGGAAASPTSTIYGCLYGPMGGVI